VKASYFFVALLNEKAAPDVFLDGD